MGAASADWAMAARGALRWGIDVALVLVIPLAIFAWKRATTQARETRQHTHVHQRPLVKSVFLTHNGARRSGATGSRTAGFGFVG